MQTSMSSTPSPSRSPSPAPIGRFAPSPTGPLHLGSLVAALASYLDAKSQQGTWLVRMEDVDETRCKPEFVEDILRTLTVFGLHWDGDVMLQSQRKPAYAQALARLSAQAHTYGCVCSRKEIADSAESGIEGPVYPGTCRHRRIGRTEYAGQVRNIAPAEAIRVLTHNEAIIFTDDVQGECSQRVESQIGDFIIRRRDGLFAYQLAVVVDDAAQGVTRVVRGADLIDSTARQIHLQQLLGMVTPRYLHIPVMTTTAGQKLSKQSLAESVVSLAAGGTVEAVNRVLIQALIFLGQSTVSLNESMPVASLLKRAASQWQITQIPAARALPL